MNEKQKAIKENFKKREEKEVWARALIYFILTAKRGGRENTLKALAMKNKIVIYDQKVKRKTNEVKVLPGPDTRRGMGLLVGSDSISPVTIITSSKAPLGLS